MRLFRSAITGRFVSSFFAKKNPATTVSENRPFTTCKSCKRIIDRDARICFWCQADLT